MTTLSECINKMQVQIPTRRDGIFDDERVLTLARAMASAADRLFSQLYALARERASTDVDALRLFANGLPSIREWTQEAVVREARRVCRMHPRANDAYRYALMRYVQELYSTAGEIEVTLPMFDNFVWHFYRIAARKNHIKAGAFLVADERASQRFVRNTIRDTFDRLLRTALHVRDTGQQQQQPSSVDLDAVASQAPRSRSAHSGRSKRSGHARRAFDDRVRDAMCRRDVACIPEPNPVTDPVDDPVGDDARSEEQHDGSQCPNTSGADGEATQESPRRFVGSNNAVRRWGLPTRSRARDLEALGRSRRAAATAIPPPTATQDNSGSVVLDDAPGGSDPLAG